MTNRRWAYIFIALALVFVILGFNEYNDSSASLKVADIEISAESESAQNTALLYFGVAGVSLLTGLVLIRRA